MHPSYMDPEDPFYLDPDEEPGPGGWSCPRCQGLNLAWREDCRGCAMSRKAALEKNLMAEGGKEQMVEQHKFKFQKLFEATLDILVESESITPQKREDMRKAPLPEIIVKRAETDASTAKAAAEERERLRMAGGGKLKPCGGAGCRRAGRLRCTGCYHQCYCSGTCQVGAWATHRLQCESFRKGFKTIVVKKGVSMRPGSNSKTEGHLVVQIDELKPNRSLAEGDDFNVGDLMVVDEKSTIYGSIAREGQEETFDRIKRDIRQKGFQGKFGFYIMVFKANREKDMEVEVNVEKMRPPEVWVDP